MMTHLDMGGKGNVHLNCSERKNEKSGPASVCVVPPPPPHAVQAGGHRREKDPRKSREEMWLPCLRCAGPAARGP